MNRDDLGELVLLEVARRCDAVAKRPKPPSWRTWEIRDDDADRTFGPRYSPVWFGEMTATDAGRVRVLRTVYRLADAGLLIVTKSEGGRLERVQLTSAGNVACDELNERRPAAIVCNPAYVGQVFDGPTAPV